MTWGRWCAARPPCLDQWSSCWCPETTHCLRPAEALKRQTGSAAGRLSCNVPCGPPSSGEWDWSPRVGRGKRHQERREAGCPGPGLWSRAAGSACRDASGRSTSLKHRSLSIFLCSENTHTHTHTHTHTTHTHTHNTHTTHRYEHWTTGIRRRMLKKTAQRGGKKTRDTRKGKNMCDWVEEWRRSRSLMSPHRF